MIASGQVIARVGKDHSLHFIGRDAQKMSELFHDHSVRLSEANYEALQSNVGNVVSLGARFNEDTVELNHITQGYGLVPSGQGAFVMQVPEAAALQEVVVEADVIDSQSRFEPLAEIRQSFLSFIRVGGRPALDM